MTEPLLTTRDLAVSYDTVEAVRGVDLTLGQGELVALLGANGAGKSSTLFAIAGAQPHTGEVTFAGRSLRGVAPQRVARRGLALVPEGRRTFPNLSVEENLAIGRTARNGRPGGREISDVYDLFPALAVIRKREAWALSGGEQQMVAIGRALLAAPLALLLDEPSLGLAPVVVEAVFVAIREIARDVPVLLVEQNTALALSVCNRGYVMAQGRVVLEGSSADLADRELLLDSYLGRVDLEVER